MFCEKCGTQVDEGSLFCPNCGNRLGGATGAPSNTGYYPPVGGYPGAGQGKKKKKMNKTIPMIIGAVLIVALVVGGFLIFHKPYLKPVKDFYEAYNAHNAQAMYQLAHPDVYEYWDLDETFYESLPGVKFKVLSTKHIKKDELPYLASEYGAADAYMVITQNKMDVYSYDYDVYNISTFTVCKVNGKWLICEAY